jgi:hypothetical protein
LKEIKSKTHQEFWQCHKNFLRSPRTDFYLLLLGRRVWKVVLVGYNMAFNNMVRKERLTMLGWQLASTMLIFSFFLFHSILLCYDCSYCINPLRIFITLLLSLFLHHLRSSLFSLSFPFDFGLF